MDMTIYGEYLFLENFIVGMLLLLLTARLSGNDSTWGKLFFGAALCGLGGFTIFLESGVVTDGILRIAMLMAAVYVAFGRKNLLKLMGIFMVLTFLSGGAVMALLLWQQEPAITHQGIIYIDIITYSKLLCFGILAFGFSYWFVIIATRRKKELELYGRIKILIEGREYEFQGFIDSGNTLVEPESGKPVVLMDEKGQKDFVKIPDCIPDRFAIVPFRTVGTDKGYLEALRTDILTFNGTAYYGIYVAFFRGYFDDYEVLLSRDFLKGGLLENA
ncbi:MAG: sigma-E processing peptidase SpoIIGA [Firmicutes bacterium]|nr:sigma-E processing peptidase SpoIIGA [Bacillota bacterium]